jgi:hypothetical protein
MMSSLKDSNDNVVVLSDSDEEEEMREEDTINAEAPPPSTTNSLAPKVSVVDADDEPEGVQDDNSDGGDETGSP